jgi:hypothetical protein
LYSEAALPETTRQNIPSVDEIQKYRSADAAEHGIQQNGGGVFVGGNDGSNLGGYPTGSRLPKK